MTKKKKDVPQKTDSYVLMSTFIDGVGKIYDATDAVYQYACLLEDRLAILERPNFLIRAYRWLIEPIKPGYWE